MKNKSIARGEEKECIKTNKSILFSLWLISVFPEAVMSLIIHLISNFFYLFARKVRVEIRRFQKTLRDFRVANGKPPVPKRIDTYKTILSFSYCVIEKLAGWVGKIKYEKLVTHDDDLADLVKQLESGKGAFLIGSHLGNIELLRSLTAFNETACNRKIPVLVLMEVSSTAQFNNTIKKVNPDFDLHALDSTSIGPESIIKIQEHIASGGIVVVTGDRTDKKSSERVIRQSFLGKEANFPYGVYLIAALAKTPIHYIFGLRTKNGPLHPKHYMFIEKSKIDFTVETSRKERNEKINALCSEFVQILEKYAQEFPYQWYNFYNFWENTKAGDGESK